MFFNRWIVKQTVLLIYHELLLSNDKEQTINHATTWMNLQKIMLSEKANPKGYILYDSI